MTALVLLETVTAFFPGDRQLKIALTIECIYSAKIRIHRRRQRLIWKKTCATPGLEYISPHF